MSDEFVKIQGADGIDGIGGPCMVVDEHSLSDYTHRGWRLVATFEKDIQLSEFNQELRAHIPVLRRGRFYLLNQSGDLAIKDAVDAERTARQRADELEHEMADVKRALAELDKTHAEAKKEAAETDRRYEAERRRLWGHLEGKDRMERDLAKIRSAIGELRWKEILGS